MFSLRRITSAALLGTLLILSATGIASGTEPPAEELIKLAPVSFREKSTIEEAVSAAYEAGRKYIRVASWELTGRKEDDA